MTELRILTVRQPWAWAIIHAGKDVENRTRNIAGDYRGPVAIHAGLQDDDTLLDYGHPMAGLIDPPCPHTRKTSHNSFSCDWCSRVTHLRYSHQGHIIGIVDLVGAHRAAGSNPGELQRCSPYAGDLCSPWAEPETWHMEIANPRPLTHPYPYRGTLGLRTLPTTITEQVMALAAEKGTAIV